ncbi:MAG: hypothetical protein NTX74_06970 [Flavobacterium sp.]|nr:hypothetical protein [Flavobacterium sp.]
MQSTQPKIRKIENLHIAMWLLKDTCWVLSYKNAGMFMIIPTISVAIYLTYKLRKTTTELLHNLAVCCWIIANSVWMTGEFYANDGYRPYAALFFVLGLLLVAYYYAIAQHKKTQE